MAKNNVYHQVLLGLLTSSLVTSTTAHAQTVQNQGERKSLFEATAPVLQMTPAEITARDQKLAPLFQAMDVTSAQMVNFLESQYGMSFYISGASSDEYDQVENEVKINKKKRKSSAEEAPAQDPLTTRRKALMTAAVEFYTSFGNWYNNSFRDGNGYGASGKDCHFPNSKVVVEGSCQRVTNSLNGTPESVLPFPAQIELSNFRDNADTALFARNLTSVIGHEKSHGYNKDITQVSLQSSLNEPQMHIPVLMNLAQAMKVTNLKGLDATIVIAKNINPKSSDSAGEKFHVLYPVTNTLFLAFPQPIIYVSNSASTADLVKMLKKESPAIFAYTQLFQKKMLPGFTEIAALLDKYPKFSAALGGIEEQNAEHNAEAQQELSAEKRRERIHKAERFILNAFIVAGEGILMSPILAGEYAGMIAASPIVGVDNMLGADLDISVFIQ